MRPFERSHNLAGGLAELRLREMETEDGQTNATCWVVLQMKFEVEPAFRLRAMRLNETVVPWRLGFYLIKNWLQFLIPNKT